MVTAQLTRRPLSAGPGAVRLFQVRLVPTWIWSVVSWGEGQADHSGEGWEAWPEMALTMPS